MNEKKQNYVYICFMGIIIITFAALSFRLIDWQILNGEKYLTIANENNAYIIETTPIRGDIRDCNGEELVVNFTGYNIVFNKFEISEESLNERIIDLINLLRSKGEKWIDVLPIETSSGGNYKFMQDKEPKVIELKSKNKLNLNSSATANECMYHLAKKYKCEDYNAQDKRDICSVRYNMMKMGYEVSAKPYVFAENVSREVLLIVSEQSQKNPGVTVVSSMIRKVVNGTIAPHIIGRVGNLDENDYEKLKDKGYQIDDKKGKEGIELAMEDYLRGKSGRQILQMKKDGGVLGVLETKNAEVGNTVFLTIDAKLQKVANESLEKSVKASASKKSGGVVVLDVRDFSVLAAATYPNYDLAEFIINDKYAKELFDDKNSVFLSRAIDYPLAPGSIFKPVVACAALQEGCMTNSTAIHCSGFLSLGVGQKPLNCHLRSGHGSLTLKNAIAKSCNVFFGTQGLNLGIERINMYAKRFGLGVKTGIEINETIGTLTAPEGDAARSAIGQAENTLSAMQLATYTATIANGGHRYRTHLIKKITDYTRSNIVMENNPDKPEFLEETNVSQENINLVKEGMRAVALSGGTAAGSFAGYNPAIAAKTGTAETGKSDNITFICFAPYEKPEIAIAVILEEAGGSNGLLSQSVAKDILDAYFYKKGIVDIPKNQIH